MIGRSTAALERGDKLLGALLVLVGTAGTLAVAVDGPAPVTIALAALGFGGALVGVVLRLRRGRVQEMEERETGWHLPLISLREVAERGLAYALGIDNEAPESVELLGLSPGEHPEYVQRRIDDTLGDLLAAARDRNGVSLITVSGPSKAGKSRTLLEVACPLLPDAWLIAPKDAEAMGRLARPRPPRGVGSGACVIWIDDIEEFAQRDRGLNVDALRAFGGWGRPVIVLATQGGKGISIAGDRGRRFREVVSDLLARYPATPLETELAEGEIEGVRHKYPAEAASRIAAEGLGEFMIAAPRLVDRLRNGDSAAGKAIAWAAIDCRRAGLLRPLALAELEEIYGHHLAGAPSAEQFARGIEWAAQPLYSTVALMGRPEGSLDEYSPHDYIVDWANRQGQSIDAAIWDEVMNRYAGTEDELLRIAAIAGDDTERAEAAWRRADALGSGEAAGNLGRLCEKRGDIEGALEAYRRSDERGYAHGSASFGSLLAKEEGDDLSPEDSRAALGALRRSDERGDPQGACWHGHFLKTRLDDLDGAAAAFRRAIARGHWHGAAQLGRLREEEGDPKAAEALYREADDRDEPIAARCLGVLLESRDDLEGAEAAYRRADERGDAHGPCFLGTLLERHGELEEAEAAYRRADGRGDLTATCQLGWIQHRNGDLEEAEATYRRAHERGHCVGTRRLGGLLWQDGKLDDAEAVLRVGMERGDGSSVRTLGQIRRVRGDLEGAGVAYRKAGDLGDSAALFWLGELLEEGGKAKAAESAYADAEKLAIREDRDGDGAAAYTLGRLRQRRGDIDGAEWAYRRSHMRGHFWGTTRLAGLLVNERRDTVEALEIYRNADARGDVWAATCVGKLEQSLGNRAEAVKAFTRADKRGGSDGAFYLGEMLLEDPEGTEMARRAAEAFERARDRAVSEGDTTLAEEASAALERALAGQG